MAPFLRDILLWFTYTRGANATSYVRYMTMRRLFGLMALAAAMPSLADDTAAPASDRSDSIFMLQVAPGVLHYRADSEHAKHSWLVGAEWQHSSRWLAGYSYFNNSFDQKCHYLYTGRSWQIGENDKGWYAKLTGGVLVGYREPYADKIPFNHDGIALGIVAGLGYRLDRFSIQVNVLGTAGLMVTVGYDVSR
jgi:hypothetical protein